MECNMARLVRKVVVQSGQELTLAKGHTHTVTPNPHAQKKRPDSRVLAKLRLYGIDDLKGARRNCVRFSMLLCNCGGYLWKCIISPSLSVKKPAYARSTRKKISWQFLSPPSSDGTWPTPNFAAFESFSFTKEHVFLLPTNIIITIKRGGRGYHRPGTTLTKE